MLRALGVFLAVVLGLSAAEHAPAAATPGNPIPVVATMPVLKDFAEQIGGPHVQVVSLMTGLESEHTYSPKPSDLVAVRNARLLLEVGIGLEVWVSSLIRAAGNRNLLVVTTSRGIGLIREEGAAQASRDDRPGHAGNPHIWLDPENAKAMIRHITDALSRVDPSHSRDYRENQAAYLRELDRLQTELMARTRHLPDRRVVVHHPAWPYFARRFGLTIVATIMTQPGAEPSAKRLHDLIQLIRKERIRVIVSEPQLNKRVPDTLAHETGAHVIVLTPLPGGVPGTETYLDLLRYNVNTVADALEVL